VVAEGMIMVYLIARGHRHGRKVLYAHILNLSDPWQVKSLSLDENAGSVTVTIEIAETPG
jgi:hypothetical protein